MSDKPWFVYVFSGAVALFSWITGYTLAYGKASYEISAVKSQHEADLKVLIMQDERALDQIKSVNNRIDLLTVSQANENKK